MYLSWSAATLVNFPTSTKTMGFDRESMICALREDTAFFTMLIDKLVPARMTPRKMPVLQRNL
jgi:hypothetical protein